MKKRREYLIYYFSVLVCALSGTGLVILGRLRSYSPSIQLGILQIGAAIILALVFGLQYIKKPRIDIRLPKFLKVFSKIKLPKINVPKKIGLAFLLIICGALSAAEYLFFRTAFVPKGPTYLIFLVGFLPFFCYLFLEKWFLFKAEELPLQPTFRRIVFLLKWTTLLFSTGVFISLIGIFNTLNILKIALLTISLFLALTVSFEAVRGMIREKSEDKNLYFPLPFYRSEEGTHGIVDYLEQNAGISLRSLWSLKYIKSKLPPAALLFCLLLWAVTCFVKIDTYQQGAVYRLGTLSNSSIIGPGIHVKLPWPIDRVKIMNVSRLQSMTIGYESSKNGNYLWNKGHGGEEYKLLLGGGKELVSLNIQVKYKISSLYNYLSNYADPVEQLRSRAYERVMRSTVSTDLNQLLSIDRTAFAANLLASLQDFAKDTDLGIEVVEVLVENIHPPIEVANVYQDVVSADHRRQAIINNAEGEASKVLAEAQTQRVKEESAAVINKYNKTAVAISEAKTFEASYKAYSIGKGLYLWQKRMSALEKALKGKKIYIVDPDIDMGNIVYNFGAGTTAVLN